MKRSLKTVILGVIVVVAVSFSAFCGNNILNAGKFKSGNAEFLAELPDSDTLVSDALDMKKTLRFGSDGKFKILMLSDLQSTDYSKAAIKALIKKEAPDFIMLCGDIASPTTVDGLREKLDGIVSVFEENKIPWAHVYGEKDSQYLSRLEQQPVYESYEYCLSKAGYEDVYGVGNYVLPILASGSDNIVFNIWGLDSGTYLNDYREGAEEELVMEKTLTDYSSNLEYIHFNQIDWYYRTSLAFEEICGKKIPSLMFFHIPFVEFNMIHLNPSKTDMVGSCRDTGAPEVNSGMFATLVERLDVKGVFCGHLYKNDYMGSFCDIKLGFSSYINDGSDEYEGARVFVIDEAAPEAFDSYMVYTDELSIGAAERVTVTFVDDNGNQLKKLENIAKGADITALAPELPIKEGYTAAWDKSLLNIQESMTVTAVYTPISSNPTTADAGVIALSVTAAAASVGAAALINRRKKAESEMSK